MNAHGDAPRFAQVANNVVPILSFAGVTEERKAKLEQILLPEFHGEPKHTAHLTFTPFAANHTSQPLPLY